MIYHRGELARCQFGWEMSIVGVLGGFGILLILRDLSRWPSTEFNVFVGVLRAELAMCYSRQVIV